jgi:hypothetical protein
MWAAAQTDFAAAASSDAEKGAKYGERIAAGAFVSLSTEGHGRMGLPARKFLQSLPTAAVSSAVAALEVTLSAFWAGALREICVALVPQSKVVSLEAMDVYATAGGTDVSPDATVLTADVER